ncbi:uncharacterized protein LOC134266952 [Saccostrea cucullata]|uniref:uncharacterized protein LOC134266952 n=1 Tax=Saccostrea cuccullata TaxID=36930 RepID=UPI002ED26534
MAEKKRKPNWTLEECLHLTRLFNDNKKILRAKFGAGVTTQKKREVWKNITESINAANPSTVRTIEEVEKKWHNIHMKGRGEISDFRRSLQKTGGGPAEKPLSALSQAVEEVIGEENVSICRISGAFDSSLMTFNNFNRGMEDIPSSSLQGRVVEDFQLDPQLSTCTSQPIIQEDVSLGISAFPMPPNSPRETTATCNLAREKLQLEVENLRLRNALLKQQLKDFNKKHL